jgi:hypothetical protein
MVSYQTNVETDFMGLSWSVSISLFVRPIQ